MRQSYLTDSTLSSMPLLLQVFVGAASIIFTLFIAFIISHNDIKPKWLKYSMYASLCVALVAFFQSWNEKRIFTAVAKNFIAMLFSYGGIILAIFCGAVVGIRIAKKASRLYERMFSERIYFCKETYLPAELIGWVIGIIMALCIALLTIVIGHEIPGVGWRMFKD